MTSVEKVLNKLYKTDPYQDFDTGQWCLDLHGWNSNHAVFEDLIHYVRPSLIIEVGTWKGASAIHMARLLAKAGIQCEILCIDTFLGWVGAPLTKMNGFPILYWQFLANVVRSSVTDIITPFPQTSDLAAVWLSKEQINADLIYVDAAHSFDQVYDDLVHYWSLLRVGGTLFGDDYDRSGVREAVDLFAALCCTPVIIREEKWIIHKTEGSPPVSAHHFLRLAAGKVT